MIIRKSNMLPVGLAALVLFSQTAMTQQQGEAQQLIDANDRKLATIAAAGGIEPGADPRLIEHQKKFEPKTLQAISPHVLVRVGEYSVYSFVKTDDGLVAVDTGQFINQTGPAFAEAQKQTGLTALAAIIYTHTHGDHVYATNALLKDVKSPSALPVYGPRGWDRNLQYESGPLSAMFLRRGLSQLGAFLPHGMAGTMNSGLGGPVKMGVMQEGLPVNHEISQDLENHRLGGLDFVFLNTPGDLAENMAVYLKQDRVLFIGDILDGTFVPFMSARWEPGRTINGYRESITRLLEHFPETEHLVSGHGIVTSGRDNVRQRLQNARDLAIFTEDYMNRAANLGWSADEVIDNYRLPKRLAEDPYLQAFYHRLDWILRGAYVMKTGWVTDTNSLTRWTDSVEIPRLVKLMGGRDRLFAEAQAAFRNDDPRWAITLTNYLLAVNPDDQPASDLQRQALVGLAYSTQSANERHYALADAVDQPWSVLVGQILQGKYKHLQTMQVMQFLTLQLRHTDALEEHLALNFSVTNDATFGFTLVEGIVQVSDTPNAQATSTMELDRATLDEIAAGLLPLNQAILDGAVKITGDAGSAQRLASLMTP